MLVGASATSVLAGQADAAGADPTIAACERWLAVEAEQSRLSAEWGRYESFLVREFDWLRLSNEERLALPQGRKLDEIAAQLEDLDWKSDALLRALPSTPALGLGAVVANLNVAIKLIYPDGYDQIVHGLIKRAVRDLKLLAAIP